MTRMQEIPIALGKSLLIKKHRLYHQSLFELFLLFVKHVPHGVLHFFNYKVQVIPDKKQYKNNDFYLIFYHNIRIKRHN